MVGIAELKAHHKLNQKALEIHRLWNDLDAHELLPLVRELQELAPPLSALVDEHWDRKGKFCGHLAFLESHLESGCKEKCRKDIDDLIYADLPAMGYCLLRLANVKC